MDSNTGVPFKNKIIQVMLPSKNKPNKEALVFHQEHTWGSQVFGEAQNLRTCAIFKYTSASCPSSVLNAWSIRIALDPI